MIFRPYYYDDRGCAAYLFGCGTLGRCAVVDARVEDVNSYVEFAANKNIRITHAIDTHVHADHRSGGRRLAAQSGASYCLHESADVMFEFTPVHDGDEIELGNTRIKALHTRGHSPESMCLLVTDLKRRPEPWFVLTGDTLFVGAVGRPDLPGHARENAVLLHEALPSWRASAVGVYRLWRDLGYAIGAVLAGLTADAMGLPWLIAGITFVSGAVAAVRMDETSRYSER